MSIVELRGGDELPAERLLLSEVEVKLVDVEGATPSGRHSTILKAGGEPGTIDDGGTTDSVGDNWEEGIKFPMGQSR
jgi:hypothetical protein